MKYKIYLLLLASLTITNCSIYKHYIGNNQDYTKDRPGATLKTKDNIYPLTKNARYKIPKINKEFKQPITDLDPPDYHE